MAVAVAAPVASDKQIVFIGKLLSEKQVPPEVEFALLNAIGENEVTKKNASAHIEYLMKQPRKVDPAVKAAAPGFYRNADHDVFEVVKAKTSDNMYAKRMIVVEGAKKPIRWEYAAGAMRFFKDWTPMSLVEAAAYGKQTGSCMVCARTLTNPDSLAAGIGPWCAGKF